MLSAKNHNAISNLFIVNSVALICRLKARDGVQNRATCSTVESETSHTFAMGRLTLSLRKPKLQYLSRQELLLVLLNITKRNDAKDLTF